MSLSVLEYLMRRQSAEFVLAAMVREMDTSFFRPLFQRMPIGDSRDATIKWGLKPWPRFKVALARLISRYWWGEPYIVTVRISDLKPIYFAFSFTPIGKRGVRVFDSHAWTGR